MRRGEDVCGRVDGGTGVVGPLLGAENRAVNVEGDLGNDTVFLGAGGLGSKLNDGVGDAWELAAELTQLLGSVVADLVVEFQVPCLYLEFQYREPPGSLFPSIIGPFEPGLYSCTCGRGTAVAIGAGPRVAMI